MSAGRLLFKDVRALQAAEKEVQIGGALFGGRDRVGAGLQPRIGNLGEDFCE